MRTFLRGFTIFCTLAVMMSGANEGLGQGWGWGGGGGRWGDEPAPYDQSPPRPVYGQPAYGGPREGPASGSNPRCRELEAQLTSGSPNAGQDQLPRIENDMREAEGQFQRAQSDADRSNCYEDMFLFGRSLRRTPRCVDLDRQVQSAKATLGQLRAQRDAIARSNSPRGRRDDIVAELARNHCGDQYVHERETQRSHSSPIFSFFSNEEQNAPDEPPPSSLAQPPAPGYGGGSSSYRTLCVRECDGFYFPVSNYASEAKFRDDEAKCHSLCASPANLFYHRADQDVDQMVSLNGRPYASMPYAFRNRKVYIKGCSCNAREYSPEQIAKSEEALKISKRADASAGKSDAAFARRISQAVQNTPAQPVSAAPAPGDGAMPLGTVPQPNPQR
jgi:hypothetical protein